MALGIPKIIQGRLTNPHPVDLQAAQMCLPFSVALASKIALAPGACHDARHAGLRGGSEGPKPARLEERTTIALDDEVEAASNELSTAARVRVALRDGRKLSKLVPAPKGSPSQPFTAPSTRRGSRRNCRAACRDKACAEIVAMSRDLDRLDPRWLGRTLGGAS